MADPPFPVWFGGSSFACEKFHKVLAWPSVTTGGQTPVQPPGKPARDGVPLGTLAGLGAQFAIALVCFGYLGSWLDRRWQSEPWCLLLGVLLGGGGVFYISYRRIMAHDATLNGEPPTTPRPPEHR